MLFWFVRLFTKPEMGQTPAKQASQRGQFLVYHSILQYIIVRYSIFWHITVMLQYIAVYYSSLLCHTIVYMQYSSIVVQQYSSIVLQYYSSIVVQSDSSIVGQQYSRIVVQQYSSILVQQSSSIVVQQYGSIVVQQYSSTVVQLQWYSSIVEQSRVEYRRGFVAQSGQWLGGVFNSRWDYGYGDPNDWVCSLVLTVPEGIPGARTRGSLGQEQCFL